MITFVGVGVLGKSEIEPHGSIVVVPLEQVVGGDGGDVLVVEGELVVVAKAAVHRVCVFWVKNLKTSGGGSVSVNDVRGASDSGSGELFGVG